MHKALYALAFLPFVAFADHPAPYGAPAPKLYCRDTNTSIYAEVCVPAFTTETKPVELAVKNIVDDKYCYTQTRTECEEVITTNDREICTYTYQSKKTTEPATTTQKTYERKSETMKVTTCRPSGYGGSHYDAGEHQYCREEYQTQEYNVPLVTEPLEVTVEVAVPEPVKECRTVAIELTNVVCNDVTEEKCIDLVDLVDGTVSVDQTEVILGEPNCNKVTLTLPTEACSEQTYGYHG